MTVLTVDTTILRSTVGGTLSVTAVTAAALFECAALLMLPALTEFFFQSVLALFAPIIAGFVAAFLPFITPVPDIMFAILDPVPNSIADVPVIAVTLLGAVTDAIPLTATIAVRIAFTLFTVFPELLFQVIQHPALAFFIGFPEFLHPAFAMLRIELGEEMFDVVPRAVFPLVAAFFLLLFDLCVALFVALVQLMALFLVHVLRTLLEFLVAGLVPLLLGSVVFGMASAFGEDRTPGSEQDDSGEAQCGGGDQLLHG
jgi:hypothetical protein